MKNKKMNHKLLLILLLLNFTTLVAQDQFSMTQHMLHQPFINGAAIGSYSRLNAALIYRNQWVGIEGAPKTLAFNINSPINLSSKSHVGLTILNEEIGVRENIDISVNYAYRMQVNKSGFLALSLSPTIRILQADFQEVNTASFQLDPSFSSSNTQSAINFKFGSYYFSKKFYVGFASPNLLSNSFSSTNESVETDFDFDKIHFYLHGGYSFQLNNNYDLNTSSIIKQVSASPTQVDFNIQVEYLKTISAGLVYRTSQEVAGLLSFKIKNTFRLAYSYDYAFGDINDISSGSHEIMLIFLPQSNIKNPIIYAPRF